MRVPLYVICPFSFVAFFILSLIFVSLITMCLGVFLLGFILPGTLCFLDLVDYFLSHVMEVSSYYLFECFLRAFFSLSSPSGTPITWMLVSLLLSQRPLRLSAFLFILFSIFCSVAVIYTQSFIYSCASVILLVIPSSILFISVCSLVLLGLW